MISNKGVSDLYKKVKPLEERAQISLESNLDDYSIINDLLPEDDFIMHGSLDMVLDDPEFSEIHPFNLFKAYRTFVTAWWREIIQRKQPSKENSLSYLIYLVFRENYLGLMNEKEEEIRYFLHGEYDSKKRNLQKLLAYHEYALSDKIETSRTKRELISKAIRNIKVIRNILNDEEAERFLFIKIYKYRQNL